MSLTELSDPSTVNNLEDLWQQGQLVEVFINDLSDTGEGVGRWGERVVFVPDSVPGDRTHFSTTGKSKTPIRPRQAARAVVSISPPHPTQLHRGR